MSPSARRGGQDARGERKLTLRLDRFAWETIDAESAAYGVSAEDFVTFAVLYYAADIDSGRIARRISRRPRAGFCDDARPPEPGGSSASS